MKRWLIIIVFGFCYQNVRAQSFMERGIRSFNDGDIKQAINWFNWAIKADSSNPVGYLNRAQAKLSANDHQAAFHDFEKAVQLNPKDGDAQFWLALCAFRNGEFSLAIDANTKALELGTRLESQAFMNRAQTYIRTGNLDKALSDYDSVIARKDPHLMQAYFDRGQLLLRQNKIREALRDLKEVVELNAENIQLCWDVGRLSYDIEEYTDALTYYSKAIDRMGDPQPEMLLIRGETFEKLKSYEAAIRDYTRVIELGHDLANAYYLRGQANARAGLLENACTDWKKANELGHPEATGVVVYNCK